MTRREFNVAILAGTLAASPRGAGAMSRQALPLRVNGDRLNAQLTRIGRGGANPQGGVTRLGYSEEDRQARLVVEGWMREAGLTPTTDFAGNLIHYRAPRRDGRSAATRHRASRTSYQARSSARSRFAI